MRKFTGAGCPWSVRRPWSTTSGRLTICGGCFLTIRRSPTCARQTSKSRFFSLFDGSVKSRAAIYRKYGAKEFLTDILVNLAQLGTTFAVPVYVAWGVMSGNIGGIGVYATLIASSLALREALNALGWWSSQVALGVAYAQKVQRFFRHRFDHRSVDRRRKSVGRPVFRPIRPCVLPLRRQR